MPNVTIDVDALHNAVQVKRNARNMSLRQVGVQTGVNASTIMRLGQSHHPDASTILSICRWLKMDVESFAEPRITGGAEPISVNTSGMTSEAAEALALLAECGERIAAADRAAAGPPNDEPA